MKVKVEIVKSALQHAPRTIENLNEKELVPKMVLRRRLTRTSKILINLAHSCSYKQGVMIYGSAYGELLDTIKILESLKDEGSISPSTFQNSVYNTAASYYSIVEENKSEIITLSCGDATSYNVMQQGALALLSNEEVFVSTVEAMNFEGVDFFNDCKAELEYGIAFTIKKTDKPVNATVANKQQKGVPLSLTWMKNLYDICEQQNSVVIEVDL
jgi:hypothetical protein